MDKPRMIEQIIKYSDGSETSVKYNVDESALQAVEARVLADTSEDVEEEVVEHVVSQEDVDNNPGEDLEVGDVVGLVADESLAPVAQVE